MILAAPCDLCAVRAAAQAAWPVGPKMIIVGGGDAIAGEVGGIRGGAVVVMDVYYKAIGMCKGGCMYSFLGGMVGKGMTLNRVRDIL
jgi:hypothetical protein